MREAPPASDQALRTRRRHELGTVETGILPNWLLREWAESSEAAARDVLTGLLNRRGLRSATADVVEATWESGGSVSVAFIDVNGLKPVNDTFGHDAGDVLLRAVAQALRSSVRAQDWVARWGGDEFVVVSVNSQLPPHVLASRVAAALAKAPPPEGVDSWAPQVSVGQASAHAGEQTSLEELIESADEDMYAHRRAVREEQTWGR